MTWPPPPRARWWPATPSREGGAMSLTTLGAGAGAVGGVAARTVYRSDTFTRADSASSLGTPSDGGSAWATSDTWGISTNRAYNAGADAQSTAVLESSKSDVLVQAT